MGIIRWILGRLILSIDFLTTPKSVKRPTDLQATIDAQTTQLALYQYAACPFCVKVRRSFKRHALNIETRDAKREPSFGEELQQHGGKLKVPCLKIVDDSGDVKWIYESSNIITYLEDRFVGQSLEGSSAS